MFEDQAAGLRRLFSRGAARVLLVAEQAWPQRGWLALNLAAAFSRAGEQVVVLDSERDSLAALWGARCRYELGHVLDGDRRLVEVIAPGPESSVILPMRRASATLSKQGRNGHALFARLLESFVEHDGLLIVPLAPARLELPLWRLGAGDVMLCAGEGTAAATRAYATIKTLNAHRPHPQVRVAFSSARGAQAPRERFAHMQGVVRRFLGSTIGYAGVLPGAELRQGTPGRTLYEDAPIDARLIDAIAHDAAQWQLPRLEFDIRTAAMQYGESVTI